MAVLTTNNLIALALFAPVALGLAAPFLERLIGGQSARLLALGVGIIFFFFVTLLPGVVDGEEYAASLVWIPALDLSLALRVDGLALFFALLVTGIGALVICYAGAYLGDADRARFFLYLLLFLAAMLGIVLADNLILLFVFWELTSITSFMLIGFEHGKPSAREAGQQALLVTGVGGLALLAGLLLLGISSGTWEVSALSSPGMIDAESTLVLVAFWCVAAGAFTKSAQFPFHFWLPAAMAAPTPISAFLHSATMVKAGVYLLARMHPALGDVSAWSWALPAVGGTTMVVTAVLAIHESDLKRVLAYSTVSALGTMVFLVGVGTPYAMTALIVFILAHALYKAALFMVAGTIDHAAGTRDRTMLGGLRGVMPLTAMAAVIAGISMSGLPPAAGFLAKETLLEAAGEAPVAVVSSAAAVVVGALTLVAVGMVAVSPFFGRTTTTPRRPHEGTVGLWLPALTLAVLGIAVGVLAPLGAPLLQPAVSAAYGSPVPVVLGFWHGFNLVLLLTAIAVGAGLVGFWQLAKLRRLLPVGRWNGDEAFRGALEALATTAYLHTRLIQNGSLRRYLIIALLAASILSLGMLVSHGGVAVPGRTSTPPEVLGVAALLMGGSLAAAWTRSRLRAVAAVGGVGFGTAMLFAFFSAPDVAMTQVLVDILIVVLFVSVFRHLPTTTRAVSSRLVRVRDAAVSITAGITVTLLTWAALTIDRSLEVSSYYLESSYPVAHGRNVVNTVLVDFRAMDTLGEITVLAIAAIGIIALLRLRPEDDEDSGGAA